MGRRSALFQYKHFIISKVIHAEEERQRGDLQGRFDHLYNLHLWSSSAICTLQRDKINSQDFSQWR